MTNNKTPLQEALEQNKIYTHHVDVQDNYLIIHEAAQAYADLPSKIEGLQTYKLSETHPAILVERDDILDLLKEEV